MSRSGPRENPKSKYTKEENRTRHLIRSRRHSKASNERKRQKKLKILAELQTGGDSEV